MRSVGGQSLEQFLDECLDLSGLDEARAVLVNVLEAFVKGVSVPFNACGNLAFGLHSLESFLKHGFSFRSVNFTVSVLVKLSNSFLCSSLGELIHHFWGNLHVSKN